MHQVIELTRVCVSAAALTVASWHDLKSREVPDKLWLALTPTGLLLTATQALMGDTTILRMTVISLTLMLALSTAVFYLGLFGGADAKALMSLSLTLPTPPKTINAATSTLPIFTLTVFNNALLTSTLLSIAFLAYNTAWKASNRRGLFEGLEGEPTHRKLAALATGYKVNASNILKKRFIYPLEEVRVDEDGRATRRIRVSVRIEDDEEVRKKLEALKNLNCDVWVTPALPFLTFITVGLFTSLLIGDIILTIMKTVFT